MYVCCSHLIVQTTKQIKKKTEKKILKKKKSLFSLSFHFKVEMKQKLLERDGHGNGDEDDFVKSNLPV